MPTSDIILQYYFKFVLLSVALVSSTVTVLTITICYLHEQLIITIVGDTIHVITMSSFPPSLRPSPSLSFPLFTMTGL